MATKEQIQEILDLMSSSCFLLGLLDTKEARASIEKIRAYGGALITIKDHLNDAGAVVMTPAQVDFVVRALVVGLREENDIHLGKGETA